MSQRFLGVAFNPVEAAALQGFAERLGFGWDLLLLGGSAPETSTAEKVLDAGLGSMPPADALAKGIAETARQYSHVGAVSSMISKDVMARVAGILDAAAVTDCLHIDSPKTFKRPMVAGAVIATVEVLAEPVVITFRPAGFPSEATGKPPQVDSIVIDASSRARILERRSRGTGRPDLTQAKVIVSGGRPLKDAETFEKVIGGLADALGGAVGATRAAVDSGIAPNELQVGQTGKTVAPNLYIAAGISGSTQHMAGIKDSKLIVAINKDPEAPIFDSADLGIVGDLFDVIPALKDAIRSS